MHELLTELRSAARGLARSPAVTISAVLCLALGIGATTAISSVLSRALFQPLPFREPDRLVAVHRITPQSGPFGGWVESAPNYLDLARATRQLDGLAALTPDHALVQLGSEAIQARVERATGNLWPLLGTAAERGRLLAPEDDRQGAAPVVAISDEFWRTKLGAEPRAVGRLLTIDGAPTTIVGILPADFRVPHGGNVYRADLWLPMRFTPDQLTSRGSNYLLMLGRLAPRASVASAQAELRGLFANLVATYPQLRGENVRVAPLQAENVAAVRTPLLLLFGAVCMVLLIAATNVAALLLARAVRRRREMAVRVAIGASRWDAMRPALVESLVITLVGAAIGLALAVAGVRTIGALAAARIPQIAGAHVDLRVVAFALGLAVVVALLCGLVPAWRGATVDPQDALRGGRGGGSGREHHRALHALVVVEIALSLVLLIGAGLVLKGFVGLLHNEPGFDTSHVLTMEVTTSATRYPDATAVRRFLEPALASIRALPGVESAGSINLVPYVEWGASGNVAYEGRPADDPTRLPLVETRRVSPSFFDVTRQRLLSGRLLRESDDDRPGAAPVTVVNEALVKRDFSGRDPVGTRFTMGDTTQITIVGVVSDIRNVGPFQAPRPEMDFTYAQAGGATTFPLLIRVRGGDPTAVAGSVRAVIRAIDPTAAVTAVRPMSEVIARSLGRPRFYFSLLGAFAAVALVLAIAGLYGVLSYAVEQRTREIGIRAALGSSPGALVRMIGAQGLRLVVLGLVLGFVVGAVVTRLMTFMLYGVSPLDMATWAAAGAVLLVASMVATLVPAGRATRVDPLIAMRVE